MYTFAAHSMLARAAMVRERTVAAFPFLKHLGIYVTGGALLRLVKFPVSPLENAESWNIADAGKRIQIAGRQGDLTTSGSMCRGMW